MKQKVYTDLEKEARRTWNDIWKECLKNIEKRPLTIRIIINYLKENYKIPEKK